MRLNHIYNIYIALIAIMFSAVGCSNDNLEDSSESGDAVILVRADIDNTLQSRAYQAEGTVKDGVYNLTFPTTVTDKYNIGEVRFGITTENPQIGYVTLPGNLPLKWLSVGGGSTPTLYLDNVPRSIPGATTEHIVTLPQTDNPYIAAPFDSISGSNDLLWGAKMFQRNAGTLHFDLQHAMARVRIRVTADNTNGDIDLTGATVKITNLNQTPLSFNRLEGTLALDTDNLEAYSELVFVNPDDENLDWIWSHNYQPTENKTVYQSRDFVLPPQDLLQDNNRPQLIITLKNGNTYSGILPSAMLIYDGSHTEPSYPVALSFLSQYVLTIRTVITEEPPSLNFMPVYVMRWVDKGSFDEEAHQSGIYLASEFYKLIDYYNRGNVFQLDRYGKQKDIDGNKIWVFDFWSSVVLDYDMIHGNMLVNSQAGEFTFSYNNFSIFVKYDDSDDGIKPVNPSTLHDILTQQ